MAFTEIKARPVDRGNCLSPTPTPEEKAERYKDQIRGHAKSIRLLKTERRALQAQLAKLRTAETERDQAIKQLDRLRFNTAWLYKDGILQCGCLEFFRCKVCEMAANLKVCPCCGGDHYEAPCNGAEWKYAK